MVAQGRVESHHRPRCCYVVRFLLPLILLVSACGSTDATAVVQGDAGDLEPIAVSMSLYIVATDDVADESLLSSQRRLAEVEEIAARMKETWSRAGIELSVETVARIEVPANVLADVASGDTSGFLQAAGSGAFVVPGAATINGFYVRRSRPSMMKGSAATRWGTFWVCITLSTIPVGSCSPVRTAPTSPTRKSPSPATP